jgi:hypothetical protein
MIQYKITAKDLKEKIQNESPGWLAKARKRTNRFRLLKRYSESSSIWSEVKPAYIKVQEGKCAFCERQLEKGQFAPIDWDVEHFRPKGRIQLWPAGKEAAALNFSFSCGPSSSRGYYLLPYHYLNYTASCKVCNSRLKRDYFPIAAKKRSFREGNPARLLKEKPFLIYPITELDEDPESILTFQGYVCIPVANSGERHKRALVTIAFFHLNDRDLFLEQRARLIIATWNALRVVADHPDDQIASEYLESIDHPSFPHANCVRSFVRVYQSDRALAQTYAQKATEYLSSKIKGI